MIELPRGVWTWLTQTACDLARIAAASEAIADELAKIRKTLEDHRKEDE